MLSQQPLVSFSDFRWSPWKLTSLKIMWIFWYLTFTDYLLFFKIFEAIWSLQFSVKVCWECWFWTGQALRRGVDQLVVTWTRTARVGTLTWNSCSERIQLCWKASGNLIPRQDCQLPRGRFSRLLGNAGQLETETELILILGKDHMTSQFVLARWSVRCRECLFSKPLFWWKKMTLNVSIQHPALSSANLTKS